MGIRQVRILVMGRVQGVFFRDYTFRKAQNLLLKGFVRNIRSGGVEIEVQGEASDVEFLIQWCYEGSPMSLVETVSVEERTVSATLSSFSIIY